MIIKSYFLFYCFLTLSIHAQSNFRNVIIKVYSDSLTHSTKIYVTGNNSKLGNWQPKLIELEYQKDHWEKKFTFELGELIEYKFTKGNWESEALNKQKEIPDNHSIRVISDTTLIHTIKYWKNELYEKQFEGGITGEVVYHRQIKHNGLLPRDVVVWLPHNYGKDTTKKYPVLYMNDGQNLFDPSTSFQSIDWQIDEAADSLIKKDIIDELIIVGIYSTEDRDEEYSSSEKGLKYMQFMVTNLKPFIDSEYRTLANRKYTAVGGSSMGGLASFMLAWNYSSYFSHAFCFSPAFMFDNFDYTSTVNSYWGTKKDIKLYFYNGGKGIEKMLQSGVDSMINVLHQKGFIKNENLFVVIDSTAEHNENAWAKQIPDVLNVFYKKKSTSEKQNNNFAN